MPDTNSLKTRSLAIFRGTLHLVGTVHVYIHAIAFSAGLNGIQVDQETKRTIVEQAFQASGVKNIFCRELKFLR